MAQLPASAASALDETAIELSSRPAHSLVVHIPAATVWAHFQGGDVNADLSKLEGPAGIMIDDLLWWTVVLKAARASGS
jgi:hypothetical protein